ncbi:extracellular solute-binding protein [Cohnella suwonensis]|uniref:Extracellular solute-binding protein n=1 Tax=Cohnella suwonensis TaxID=696072 RepID=A0ABW0M3P3_9BACL
MKASIRLTRIGIALLAAIAVIAGCSNNGNDTATNGNNTVKENVSETKAAETKAAEPEAVYDGTMKQVRPASFSFYGNYDWMTIEPWGADPTSKWVKENLKIEVTPIQSSGAAEAKLNTMIASEGLPDVMMLDRGAIVERLRQANQLVALDDYLDKYPNLKKYAGEDTLNMLRSDDGKLYIFPDWYTSSPNGNGGWVINTKIYKELGSPKLETFDDLYAYLKTVKEKYTDVIPLEVGFSGKGIEVMSSGFAENHPTQFASMRYYPEGDKLVSIFKDPVYKDAMLFANKLFREKLITQDAFTQKDDQVKEKLKTGKVAVLVFDDAANYGREGHNAWKAIDPSGGYQAIWPIHKAGLDPNKILVNEYNSLGWNAVVITKNAKDPEAIFAYLDWSTSPEGQRILFFGPQGLFWDEADSNGVPIPNEAYKTTPEEEKDKLKLGSFVWAGNTTYVDSSKAALEMTLPEEQRNWSTVAQSTIYWKTSMNMTEFVNLDPLPDTEEGIAQSAVKDLYTEVRAKLMFAKSDEEVLAIIDKADKDSVKLGFDKLLDYHTAKWKGNLEKMKK